MSESREIPGTPVSAASAARISGEEIELLVVPLNADPLAWSMGPVTASTLHRLLGEALDVPTFTRSVTADSIRSDANNNRIQDALYHPERFAHREFGESMEHYRAKAIACALHYDDEQLRDMGLPWLPESTEEFDHEAIIRAVNPGIGEITPGPTVVAPGPQPTMHRWRGPWEPEQTYERFDAVIHTGVVYVLDADEHRSQDPPHIDRAWLQVPGDDDRPVFAEPRLRMPALDRFGERTDYNRLPAPVVVAVAVLAVLAVILAIVALITQ